MPVLLLGSCTVRPPGILSGRKMEQVLYDLHRADGVLLTSGIYYRQDNEVNAYYLWVMEKNGTSQAQFDSSLVWYTDNPQIFNKIYPRVIRRLEKERSELIRQYGERGETIRKPFVPSAVDTLIAPVLFTCEKPIFERLQLSQPPASSSSPVSVPLLPEAEAPAATSETASSSKTRTTHFSVYETSGNP